METASDLSIASLATLDDVIQRDKKRYIRKGYGLIFAVLIALSTYVAVPHIMKYVHDWFEGMEEFQKFCLVQLSCSQLSYLVANAYMFIIYSLKLPFFERYKVDSNPWPWEKNPEQWKIQRKKVFVNWVVNNFVTLGLMAVGNYKDRKFKHDYDSIPTYFELAWQIAFCMIAEDMSFYWVHRALHHPKLYFLHKKHHEFYNTISIAAEYQNPIEFLLTSIATATGPLILGSRMHLYTVGFWYIVRVFETIDGHCGYEFSWSPYRLLPLSGSSEYHHFHHSHNVGNYSSFFYYWDTLCGTNKDYFRFRSNEQQLEKLRQQFLQNQQKMKQS